MPDNKNSGACRVVIVAVGDPHDGGGMLGPDLLGSLREQLHTLPEGVSVIEGERLQLEHMLELRGCALALFIASDTAATAPAALKEIAVADGTAAADAESPPAPAELLHMMNALARHAAAPTAFALTLRAANPDASGATGRESISAALPLLRELLESPNADDWRRCCAGAGSS